MASNPQPVPGEPQIERKVTTATITTAVTSAVIWVLATYVFKGEVSDEVKLVVGIVVPAVITFAVSYKTKHTWRRSSLDGSAG